LWVAGFDIIYALQDLAHDRAAGLRSVPAWLGSGRARLVSATLHAGSAAALIAVAVVDPRFGWRLDLAVAAVVTLLLLEHLTVARWGTSRIALSFFTLNGVISVALGVAGVMDVLGGV
ncbi:MAG: 4-hydroxybenzoate octaprenyltransferase, partial [Phycisphaerae bacterium]|nr:4-hydroxybenzoate octaprenyltransferase [Phycisphaerae bacterium]